MQLFHGSNVAIEHPDLAHSRERLDFGKGFYTTTNRGQALDFAHLVTRRRGGGQATLTIFEFDPDTVPELLSLRSFAELNEEWLDFVTANRLGLPLEHRYDILIGPVADDKVIATVQLYLAGALRKDAALVQLKVNELFDQVVFVSEAALELLEFVSSEELS